MSSGTPWRTGAHARPIVAWRDAELAAVAALLSDIRAAWCREWGLRAPSASTCVPVTQDASSRVWMPMGTRNAGAAWRSTAPGLVEAIHGELFGTDAPAGPLATEVSAECLEDLFTRLATALGVAPGPAPLPDMGAWSGAVQVPLCEAADLLLDRHLVRALLDARATPPAAALAPAVPLQDALSPSAIALEIRLEGCALDLASLQDLRIGDVVRTSHALQRPARVETRDGAALFDGFLARAGARKAVELSRSTDS